MVKKVLQAKKAGHMGTLDPFATGLLLCGIDQGTRISKFFLNGSKRYKARVHLGIETDTFDLTGSKIAETESLDMVSKEKIVKVINAFMGSQKQVPPSFSALKHKGKPLYKYARQGKKITKPAREIEIFEIAVENIDIPFVDIDVFCSAGTYIRTIAYDIGRALGCGAHLTALERTESCGFSLDKALKLEEIEDMDTSTVEDKIIPLAEALSFMPKHIADEKLEKKIRFGQKIGRDDQLPPCDDFMRILTQDGDLAAVVEYDKIKHLFNYSCVFLH